MDLFKGASHPAVQQLSLGSDELAVCDLSDVVMDEVEQLSRSLQHMAPYQVFHRGRALGFARTGGTLKQSELEFPPNHCGNCGELLAPVTQAVQTAQDQLTDALRHWQMTSSQGLSPFPQFAQRFHDHEGMALARCPDLLTQTRRNAFSATRPRDRPDELKGLRLIERRERQAQQPVVPVKFVEGPPEQGSVPELVVARSPDDEDWCALTPPAQVGQEPQAHLVCPVKIV